MGSSSLITNLDGEVVQHIEYVPFGEVFIEERNNKWNTPYLFNAKELDEETGLYYYGARYYDPRVSVWLSVDLLQERYPNISTYAYTFQNPIKYIDPNGLNGIDLPIMISNADVAEAQLKQKNPNWAIQYAEVRAKEMWEGLKEGLHDLSKALAPIRPADEDDPKTIAEWWEGLKNAPSAVVDTYSNGSLRSQTRLTVGLLGLLKGKVKGVPKQGVVLANISNSSNKLGIISNAGEILGKFGIAKYYTYTKNGVSIYVAPHALKHLEELGGNAMKLGDNYYKLLGQVYQKALHSAIDDVLKKTGGKPLYDHMYKSGGNEIMFGKPRNPGELPSVKHFR